MTSQQQKGRAAWLATARPNQLPPKEYDLWTLWGGRGSGKTRAAFEEALDWARTPVETPGGMRPGRTAIFVRSIEGAMSLIVYGRGGLLDVSEMHVEIDRLRNRVTFENGSEWRFFRFSEAEMSRGVGFSTAWVEDSNLARRDELEDVIRAIHMETKWAKDPKTVLTCQILPPWPMSKLWGGRNHLAMLQTADNTALSQAARDAIAREPF